MPNYERLHYLEQDIAERRERAIIEFTSSRFYNSKETYHVIDELLLTQPLIDSQLKRDLFYLADEH